MVRKPMSMCVYLSSLVTFGGETVFLTQPNKELDQRLMKVSNNKREDLPKMATKENEQ